MFPRMSIQSKLSIAMILVALMACAAYALILLDGRKAAVKHEADETLQVAARSAQAIVGADYHDRIAGPASISKEEFERIVATYDKLCTEAGLQYLWSLMVLDDRIVFTSATHSVLSDPTSDCAKFLEPHTNPNIYEHAFATMRPEYSTFHDKWGEGRMVLIPAYDKQHRKHLFAASIRLTQLDALTRKTVAQSIVVSALIALAAVLISLLLARSLAKPIVRLTRASRQMAQGDLTVKLLPSGSGEVAILAESFDAMRRAIHEQMVAQHNYQDQLESMVHQRTAQLEAANVDLAGANQALRDSQERYRAIVETYDGFIYICSQDYRIEFMNQRLIDRTGRNAVGEPCYKALHDRDSTCPWCINDRVFAGETVQWEIQSPKDGRWYYVVDTLIRQANGKLSKQSMFMDITHRRQMEEALRKLNDELENRVRERTSELAALADRNHRLVRELEHRVRNNLAGLLGLVAIMRTRATSVDTFATAIESRLIAMAHIQKLLAEANWGRVDLRTLVTSTLEAIKRLAHYNNAIAINGPDAQIPIASVVPLTLVLVEWFTNSCKYGAHATPDGRLIIRWEILEDARLVRLTWQERGGMPIAQPLTPSLGTELVNGFVTRELHGQCQMTFPPEGAEHTVEFAWER